MSAYMVENSTINKIVNSIRHYVYSDDGSHLSYHLQKIDIDTTAEDWEEKLAYLMALLNAQGIQKRYGETPKIGGDQYSFEFKLHLPDVTVLKALDCYLYQCNEGDNDTTLLYKFLDNVFSHFLMKKIIRENTNYEDQLWG